VEASQIKESLYFSSAMDLLISLVGVVSSIRSSVEAGRQKNNPPFEQSSYKIDQGATVPTSDKVFTTSPVAAQL
jgi:hypothetical protein